MAFDHAKFLARFVDEAREHCARIGTGLLAIEKNPSDTAVLNDIFRSAHTIKGSSRMMKLLAVTETAHRMEDLLDAVRNGLIHPSKVSDLLFKGVDALSAMLETIAAGGAVAEAPAELCRQMEAAAGGNEATPPSPDAAPSAPPPAIESAPPQPAPAAVQPFPVETPVSPPERQAPVRPESHATESIRISAAKLDELIKLMGEIVSTQSRFRRLIQQARETERLSARHLTLLSPGNLEGDTSAAALAAAAKQLFLSLKDSVLVQEQLTAELQETSLKMRMFPLSTVFDTFGRTVRDISRSCGKEIDFLVEGGETELDKKIIEKIGDPLIHMIRNAVDHGIETAEERTAAGKPPRGLIRLSACYDGGSVTIILRDDGRGIPLDRIREKAIQKRLCSEEELAKMSDSEVTDLIFRPGFSTSPIITDLSGRGVGMDVVRANIVDDLKGSITIESSEGEGTAFFLRLPLNLAVFPLLLVSVNGIEFALPANALCEMVSVRREELIEVVNKKAVRLREQIVPVESLGRLLSAPGTAAETDELLVIVVKSGTEKLGLVVDGLIDEEDMVVKPLPSHLQSIPFVSGVTVGGGNRIINVLHIPALFKAAKETRDVGRSQGTQEKRRIEVLVVDDSLNTREIEKSILEAYGYSVTMAGDGMEALEKTRDQQFDAVITDVEMPRLDGFSLTERLRSDERYRTTPIIIVTSLEKAEDKRRGILAGADAYIVKGAFDQSNLLETVQNLVG